MKELTGQGTKGIPRRRLPYYILGATFVYLGISCEKLSGYTSEETARNLYVVSDQSFVSYSQTPEKRKVNALSIYPEIVSIPKLAIVNEQVSEAVAKKVEKENSYDLSVPDFGIATPPEGIDNLPNVTWIYGHSSYKGEKGIFASLDRLEIGDPVYLDGRIEGSSQKFKGIRFLVDNFYLADKESGRKLTAHINNTSEKPVLLMQTSVREDKSQKWLFKKEDIISKTTNTIDGDVDDPDKYILLFVSATIG